MEESHTGVHSLWTHSKRTDIMSLYNYTAGSWNRIYVGGHTDPADLTWMDWNLIEHGAPKILCSV